MSSTGRGSARKKNDQYFTRYPVALAICERLKADGVIPHRPHRMMEPSAGAGAFVSAMAETFAPRLLFRNDLSPSLMLEEHEQRAQAAIAQAWPGRRAGRLISTEVDFLSATKQQFRGIEAIIGNPPYFAAEAHVLRALQLLADDGVLAYLLPLNFLAGIGRTAGLWTDHPPEYVYTLDKRPQFLDGYRVNKKGKRVKKGTDSNEYGVFVWRKTRSEFETVVRWLKWSHYLTRFQNKVELLPAKPKRKKAA